MMHRQKLTDRDETKKFKIKLLATTQTFNISDIIKQKKVFFYSGSAKYYL